MAFDNILGILLHSALSQECVYLWRQILEKVIFQNNNGKFNFMLSVDRHKLAHCPLHLDFKNYNRFDMLISRIILGTGSERRCYYEGLLTLTGCIPRMISNTWCFLVKTDCHSTMLDLNCLLNIFTLVELRIIRINEVTRFSRKTHEIIFYPVKSTEWYFHIGTGHVWSPNLPTHTCWYIFDTQYISDKSDPDILRIAINVLILRHMNTFT